MFRSYLKIAFRSISKNKLISFINLFGLGLSMSVGMMIMIRLQDQLSYDNFHPNPKGTYRVTSHYDKKTGEKWDLASTPLPLLTELAKDTGNIESVVNIYPAFNGKALAGGKELYLNGAFTEPGFFRIFGFHLSSGNEQKALQLPNSVVISHNTAKKFYGETNPLGKIIQIEGKGDFIVTGVLEDAPGKSHINYDAYASYTSIAGMEKNNLLSKKTDDWFALNSCYTYVLVNNSSGKSKLAEDLHFISTDLNHLNKDATISFDIQRLDKITPGTDRLANDIGGGSGWSKLFFEIGVALLILFAACFNYTNLTIARALTRAKEVGIRKIVGAKRFQVFFQYVIEALLIAFIALCFAWLLLAFIIHYAPFNDGYEFIPSSTHYNGTLIIWSVCFAIFTGVVAGTSPAWILSSFKPLRVLKNMTTARILGKVSLQKALIVFQYSLSLVIIIFLAVFYRQFAYMSELDPGFRKEQVMVVPVNGIDPKIAEHEISQVNGVRNVACMSSLLGRHFGGMQTPVWTSNPKDAFLLNYFFADENFIPSMDIPFVAGSNIPSNQNEEERYIILNEKATHALGISKTSVAPGKKIWINDSVQLEIAGVVRDFNYENAGKPIAPLALRYKPAACNFLYITTASLDKEKIEKNIAGVWKTFAASQPFTNTWLDEDIEKSNSQTATISLLGYLAFIAVAIATLGLLGLVIYSIEVKRKEISIRKIIGASEKQLLGMLSKKFIRLLVIAGLIAMPIGYAAGFLFLQNFANRVNFGLVNVAACFILLLGIGLITILSQTYKAATENPVNNLRTE